MPITALSLRFACNQESREPLRPVNYDVDPIIYKANPTRIEAALFDGPPSEDTFVSNITNVSGVTLIIRKNHSLGALLINKIGTIDNTTTYATWADGTKQQFLFDLTAADTNLITPSDGTLDMYGVIVLTTNTGPITLGFFNGVIQFNGVSGGVLPPAASGFNYLIDNGILKIWNNDQQIFQALFPVGPAGAESVAVGN